MLFVKILQLLHLNGQRGLTGMVEKQQPGLQFFEMRLVADQHHAGIRKKILPRAPHRRTAGALLEHGRRSLVCVFCHRLSFNLGKAFRL